MGQRTYSDEEKRAAVRRSREIGPTKASAELGIPSGSLSCWSFKARQAEAAAQKSTAVDTSTSEVPSAPAPGIEAVPATVAADRGKETPHPAPHVAHLYTPSEKAHALEVVARIGIAAASRELRISRYSLRDWRRRAKKAAAGEEPAPTSGPDPADISAKRDAEILREWHEHPGLGPSQIRNQLRRMGIKVSTHTVRRVMEDAGYRPRKVERHVHGGTYEATRPNHMWHLDFLCRHINRATTFTLILIDDYSRFVVGHGVDDAERADMVLRTFEEATQRHGRPEMVMHDKGSAFWSWKGISRFTALLEEMGIDQVIAQEKEWNGKIEVFNGNLSKELFDVQRFYDLAEMKRRLAAHLHFYNHRRTHHALGGLLVPADRFYGRVDEVMARIEAGAGAGVHTDLLDLRDRCLELFKVTSQDGRPEVWLLGQRLFPPATK